MENPDDVIDVRLDNDDEVEDEVQDWKILKNSRNSEIIPKRGEKDFEPDGTNVQVKLIDDSREAMYEALEAPRGYFSKNRLIAVWMKEEKKALVLRPRGNYFKDMGVAAKIGNNRQGVWLNEIETVYLCERGSLLVYLGNRSFVEYLASDATDFDYQGELVALTLSHLYTLAFCESPDLLDQYHVYALLKRNGYLIQRYSRKEEKQIEQSSSPTLTCNITSVLAKSYVVLKQLFFNITPCIIRQHLLAFYISSRYESLWSDFYYQKHHILSYTSLFRQLRLIPSYSASNDHVPSVQNTSPYQISYNIWKPMPNFSKKNPPKPNFQICIVNTNKISFPKIEDVRCLLNSADVSDSESRNPDETRNVNVKSKSSAQTQTKKQIREQRRKDRFNKLSEYSQKKTLYLKKRDDMLKHGTSGKSVLLAVLQDGVLNFMNLSEVDFTFRDSSRQKLDNILPKRPHEIVWHGALD
ncbi:Piso0_005383 [Millerozyma farinosa CBS 7064]|uniref:Piso0_005383 protein n=1 Tax=Pichia sorbitophila (strain ATCC MYA-4447 / BCRC 22081 / CBS 7064 / NBRC 10061 / NRRL Y-12695) TaxID=559304 RepID=G8Y4Y8_PICSO|nr:Piso0_005383 [Millerozyma farinosa CBS 7064]